MTNAGIFDSDIILPGVVTEIMNDYTQDYDTSEFGTTESVTIIGTAFNGPVGKVTPIYSPEHAKYIFGDSFDPTTRREATLVAEIYDAWEKGCRTIYALRVSGQPISKDYQFATETDLRLRVSGIFPSNLNKDVFLEYVTTQNANDDAGVVRVYKLPERANMKEKMQGLASNINEMLITDIKLSGYGLTKDSRLTDAINIVNSAANNNVIRLSIVDKDGADVTSSSKEAQTLSLGVMFPGLYTIGRDKAAEEVKVATNLDFVLSTNAKPHESYSDAIWKELVVNSDVSVEYPIYAKSVNDLSALLPVIVDKEGDFLKPIGMIDKIATKDKIDYEEVELEEFELYKRLGSGYAQTAQIAELKGAHDEVRGYKVVVPSANNVNRVIGITDGIYSMLENHSSNYTVLAGVSAQSKIAGKMPRKDAFKKRTAGVIKLSNNSADVLELTAKIDDRDMSVAKDVIVTVTKVDESSAIDQQALLKSLDISLKAQRVESFAAENADAIKALPEGSIFVTVTGSSELALAEIVNGVKVSSTKSGLFLTEVSGKLKLLEATSGTLQEKSDVEENTAFIAICNDIPNIYKMGSAGEVLRVGALAELVSEEFEEDYTICHVEDLIDKVIVNVYSTDAQWMTYAEFADRLNENNMFAKLFSVIALTPDVEVGDVLKGQGKDKGDSYYDTALYIPYTTSDNFARHLAQHCTYTSLKTFPTHGIIGCSKLNGVNLSNVAAKVNEILAMDLDLYAKRPNGNNMLDSNNMPYSIGRNVSVVFIQSTITTGNGYSYVSNGAASYAGMVSTLDADRSSTNQPIKLKNLAFDLSNYQLSQLTGKGIVTAKNTTSGIVITDGVTMAPVDSSFRRLSTIKVLNVIDAGLRDIMAPYIGLQDNLATRNSLNTAITSFLNKSKEKLIRYYKFTILTDNSSSNLGKIKIQYVLIPYNEIKEIRNTVSAQEN